MPNVPGIDFNLYNLIYVPLIGFLTYVIICALPVYISAKKFGPLISAVVGVVISILTSFYDPAESISIAGAVVRGLVAAAVANGVYDHYKASKALINSKASTEGSGTSNQ